MQTKTFTYSEDKQKKIGLLFLVLGVVGAVLALYMWLWANPVNLMVLVGGIFMALLGLGIFLKTMLAPNKENQPAITISDEGITASTTPVVYAAGLIEWEDIEKINLLTKSMEVKLKKPDKYAVRMKNFFVRDTFLKSLKGTFRISYMETNASYNEMAEILKQYNNK